MGSADKIARELMKTQQIANALATEQRDNEFSPLILEKMHDNVRSCSLNSFDLHRSSFLGELFLSILLCTNKAVTHRILHRTVAYD